MHAEAKTPQAHVFMTGHLIELSHGPLFGCLFTDAVGRHDSVGTATRYGLDCPGSESRWKRRFPHSSRSALGPTQPPMRLVSGLFLGGKAAGA